MPKFYIAEVRDSDGNDCTVYDALIAAESRDAASDKLWKYLEAAYPEDESDGGFGTYHPCDCVCDHNASPWDDDAKGHETGRCGDQGWECSHGGLLTDEPETFAEYDTKVEARAEHAPYHILIDLTTEDN